MKRLAFVLSSFIFLTACGGGGNSNEEAAAMEESTETVAQESQEETTTESTPEEVALTLTTVGETMSTMAFEPGRLEVPAGATINLTLKNEASAEAMIHNAVFIQRGTQDEVVADAMTVGKDGDFIPNNPNVIASTDLAYPGETKTLTFTAPEEPGTYQYICTYPGHTAMKGILLVR